MDRKIMTPHEAEIDKLLQVMACLIDKLGGEVFISRHELEAYFDTPVLTRVISPDYVRFTLGEENETSVPSIIDLPEEETPQT